MSRPFIDIYVEQAPFAGIHTAHSSPPFMVSRQTQVLPMQRLLLKALLSLSIFPCLAQEPAAIIQQGASYPEVPIPYRIGDQWGFAFANGSLRDTNFVDSIQLTPVRKNTGLYLAYKDDKMALMPFTPVYETQWYDSIYYLEDFNVLAAVEDGRHYLFNPQNGNIQRESEFVAGSLHGLGRSNYFQFRDPAGKYHLLVQPTADYEYDIRWPIKNSVKFDSIYVEGPNASIPIVAHHEIEETLIYTGQFPGWLALPVEPESVDEEIAVLEVSEQELDLVQEQISVENQKGVQRRYLRKRKSVLISYSNGSDEERFPFKAISILEANKPGELDKIITRMGVYLIYMQAGRSYYSAPEFDANLHYFLQPDLYRGGLMIRAETAGGKVLGLLTPQGLQFWE